MDILWIKDEESGRYVGICPHAKCAEEQNNRVVIELTTVETFQLSRGLKNSLTTGHVSDEAPRTQTCCYCPNCGEDFDTPEWMQEDYLVRDGRCIRCGTPNPCDSELCEDCLDSQCVRCEAFYDEAGDGYDGLCPACADKAERS